MKVKEKRMIIRKDKTIRIQKIHFNCSSGFPWDEKVEVGDIFDKGKIKMTVCRKLKGKTVYGSCRHIETEIDENVVASLFKEVGYILRNASFYEIYPCDAGGSFIIHCTEGLKIEAPGWIHTQDEKTLFLTIQSFIWKATRKDEN